MIQVILLELIQKNTLYSVLEVSLNLSLLPNVGYLYHICRRHNLHFFVSSSANYQIDDFLIILTLGFYEI